MNWLAMVKEREDELLRELKSFLSIESILDETTAGPNAPFGEKIASVLNYLLELGTVDGFQTKNMDGYAGHIEYGEGKELVGILGHVDVVPATEGWTSPPFQPEFREGKLFARGASDDKGPVMAAYFALKILRELELPVSKRIRLILGGDEESRWRCMDYYLEREEMPTLAFTPDANFPIITSEKGFLDIQVRGNSPVPSLHMEGSTWQLNSFSSGKRVNIVPELATATLVGDGDVFSLKEAYQSYLLDHRYEGYAEESNDDVRLVLQGRSYHSSEPEKGLNAALALAGFLTGVNLDESGAQYVRVIDDLFVDSLLGEKLGIAHEDPQAGKVTVSVGIFSYQLGEEPFLRINVRYPSSIDSKFILTRIEERLQANHLNMIAVDDKPGHSFAEDHPLVETLARVYEEQTGERAERLSTSGATYARVLDTCVAYGPVFPGKQEMAHQTDEYIEIEDLLRATAIYAQAIYELAK